MMVNKPVFIFIRFTITEQVWFQISAAVYMRSLLFWNVTLCRLVVIGKSVGAKSR